MLKIILVMKVIIRQIVNEFRLSGKVTAIVHDNASNIKEVATSVLAEDVACGVHTFQLGVKMLDHELMRQ